MERTDILELMSRLKLYGMRAAYDEVMTTGIKRRHEPPRIVGDLLSAEIAEKQARSIKYQLTREPLDRRIERRFDIIKARVERADGRVRIALGGFPPRCRRKRYGRPQCWSRSRVHPRVSP
jgi:hypothetical protein